MSLHNLRTTVTPTELSALDSVIGAFSRELNKKPYNELTYAEQRYKEDISQARCWIAAQKEELYKEWEALPPGSHLKEAYRDQVWTWSDRDLEAIPETDTTDLSWLERPTHLPERPEQ